METVFRSPDVQEAAAVRERLARAEIETAFERSDSGFAVRVAPGDFAAAQALLAAPARDASPSTTPLGRAVPFAAWVIVGTLAFGLYADLVVIVVEGNYLALAGFVLFAALLIVAVRSLLRRTAGA